MKKILLSTFVLCAAIFSVNAQIMKNDFLTGYSVGDDLEKGAYPSTTQGDANPIMANQWNLSGKTGNSDQGGTNPKTVAPLVYAGYVESGKNVAIDLLKTESGQNRTTIYSLMSDYTYGAGTYYVAFMFNASFASTSSGNEFFAFDGNYTANGQRARFGIKGIESDENNTFMIGLGDGGTPAAGAFSGTFNFGETYLVVLKVVLNESAANPGQGDGTGTVWAFINPDITGTEPATAFSTLGITGTALKSVRGLTIRQRSTLAAQIGGFRFSDTWAGALGTDGSSIGENNADKGNVVSTKYYNLKGVEVKEPAQNSGLYIQKDTFEDGTVVSAKVIK